MALRDTALYAESWNVAYRQCGCGALLADKDTPFTVIDNAYRYWAADPFVIEEGGKVYIFAELYDYILRRGVLGYCELRGGKRMKWTPVITEPHHLSYPCIVREDGKIFLMPESGEAEELALYEAVAFPDKWEKRTVLRKGEKLADTTPLPTKQGRKALTHRVDDAQHPRLTVIDLEDVSCDEVVAEAQSFRSRPAGHMFYRGSRLMRPAQLSDDSGDGYGKGLLFCECSVNENGKYCEREIDEVRPQMLRFSRAIYLDGMHTYNASERFEVIDVKTRRFNLLNLLMRLVSKFVKE